MGNNTSTDTPVLKNETPYTWHYWMSFTSNNIWWTSGGHMNGTLRGMETMNHRYGRSACSLTLKYGDQSAFSHSHPRYLIAPYSTWTLRESFDRSLIELHCSHCNRVETCPNYAKIKEDCIRQQQQQQEEQRHLERLEREKKIEEQINKENEVARRKLSEARSRLEQSISLREQEVHHQRTHVVQQVVKDHGAAIERDEVVDIKGKLQKLLSDHQISENECWPDAPIEDRIKNLHTELTVQYCQQQNIPIGCLFTLENAIGELSLTERLSILNAVIQLTVAGDPDAVCKDVPQLEGDKQYIFHLRLLKTLGGLNPTLAAKVLLALLELFPDVSPTSKNHLSQIIFSNIWTAGEIMLFLRQAARIEKKKDGFKMDSILQTVQTYRLDLLTTLSALQEADPKYVLCMYAASETDKDIDILLNEMHEANYPQNVLSVMEDILEKISEEIKTCAVKDLKILSKREINEVQKMITQLDFAEPDITILNKVLIKMCLAVRDCSTITTQSGENIKGYFPRLTQLASLLMLLLSQSVSNKGCLLEIGTGEGKSCILAMFAVIQAIRGAKVDIVTSSAVLARRDQEEWRELYTMFDVTSSVVPPTLTNESVSENHDKRLQNAYKQQIVYGTVGDFAADTLKQEFERSITRGERKFDLVIVDEVDYMTLDSGIQVTYLSHEASGMRHVEQVLASLWSMMCMCRPIGMEETGEIEWLTGIQHFHKAAKVAVMGSETSDKFTAFDLLLPGVQFGFYTQEDLDKLMWDENETQKENKSDASQDEVWNSIEAFMAKFSAEQQYDLLSIFEIALNENVSIQCYTVADNMAAPFGETKPDRDLNIKMLLLQNGRASEIMTEKALIDASVLELKARIKYSDECKPNSEETQTSIVIPSFLKQYIENRLPVFVENALKAIVMTQGREYMIDMSSAAIPSTVSESDKHLYHTIIPVDYQASGVLEKNKRWGDGLQQFLEMKHQLAVTSLSTVTNYMSNNNYFKKYLDGRGTFGVSGTLGGNADKDFLKRHYKTDSHSIPAHRHNKMVELPTLQVRGDESEWTEAVCEAAWRAAKRGQVVLVVCEDVKTANNLHREMDTQNSSPQYPITMYTISERDNIEQTSFKKGNVIIATNLGGRGTDIKVEQEVNQCGGLFVILTHFPGNRRVEKQVFGRTARKGNPGMVQMILQHNHLAPAYQGQTVEVMRQLREEYETQRITGMETNELLDIDIKEKLFNTFCTFLKEFDKQYTIHEKENLLQMKLSDVENCFRHQGNKFDYSPALNALKESWALWLILHEQDIERHEDFPRLKDDLLKQLENTQNMILKGQSQNFYDHLKQAKVRTDLHCQNITKSDYDAISSWKNVAQCDPFYRAVALYNQAYIIINLKRRNYKEEAIQLLKDAKETLGVYVSETTNTAMACQMAKRANFEPHHEGVSNFESQMQSRMNIFDAWEGYICRALRKLEEIEENSNDAVTEATSVYALSDEKDHITTNELMALYEYGLGIVFEVRAKPKFNINALICFILGVAQVFAGVLVCTLSCGSASQFGFGLISEGVSDMISGVVGMATGAFTWASWAISKAISICISLLTAGFGVIKRAIQSVYKTAKGLLQGTTTLSSVAKSVLTTGKQTFMSCKNTAILTFSSASRSTVRNLSSNVVVRQTFKQASKYAVQEVAKQAVTYGLHYTIDAGVHAALKKIMDECFRDLITNTIKHNDALNLTLTEYVCSGVPKSALQKQTSDFKIYKKNEEDMKELTELMTRRVIPDLMTDYTRVHEVINRLTEVSNTASELMKRSKPSGYGHNVINASLLITKLSLTVHQMVKDVPTENVIRDIFVPKLIVKISENMESYDKDGRHNLPDVIRLKDELLATISESVTQAFTEACAGHMTTIMTQICKGRINKVTEAAGKVTSNLFGRCKTQDFFQEQRQRQDMKSVSKTAVQYGQEGLHDYINNISNIDRPASELDLYVLTKSELLQGKGIKVMFVDKHGKQIYETSYPGADPSAGNITLKLAREPEKAQGNSGLFSRLKKQIQGVKTPHTGHYTVVHPDGRESPVKSEGQNCLYHAVIQATSEGQQQHINQQAASLRSNVQREVQENFQIYGALVGLQKRYDELQNNPGKFAIVGGAKKRKNAENADTHPYLAEFMRDSNNSSNTSEYDIAKEYDLGCVGTYEDLKNTTASGRGKLEKDHIIPKAVITKVLNCNKFKQLQQTDPEFHHFLNSYRNDDKGEQQLTIQVLYQHHRTALTTGNSTESQQCRGLLTETLLTGNVERLVKQCIIMGHPQSSVQLRHDAGISRDSHLGKVKFSEQGTNGYYKAGYCQYIDRLQKKNIIDQNKGDNLKSWLKEDMHLDNHTSEYQEILDRIKQNKNLSYLQ